MKKNEKGIVKIEDYTDEGFGVARADGYVLFVPGTIAGEEAEVLVVKAGKSFGYGKVLRFLKTAPCREEPACALARRCGGCAFWHLSYEEEARLKAARVKNHLKRIGGIEVPLSLILAAKEQTAYRNKAQFPIRQVKGEAQGGFYAPGSHGVVSGAPCRIQPPLFNDLLEWTLSFMKRERIPAYEEQTYTGVVRHLYLRQGVGTGQVMVCLVINGKEFPKKQLFAMEITAAYPQIKTVAINYNDRNTNVVLGKKTETVFGEGYIEDLLLGKRYRIAPKAFYQVNRAQTEVLYSKVAELANLSGEERLLDLYCGIGTIGLSMAGQVKELVGVEIVPDAVENAKENARINGVTNAEFFCADAKEAAARFAAEGKQFDCIIVDPPRKGCDEQTLEAIRQMAPKKLIYVSCNSATLARDLKTLSEDFEIQVVVPVDLFPRTHHVETVVYLKRRPGDESLFI
ncbi:MAG: 23S rRNA (uracil(1939)-C(5))-methyltransferase RlmD [Clostridia bacterium]|nr:23S rRNA (uracil(1939)-C(5))-methyltransferase RlmD [Clostridia bacterium]